MYGELQNIQNIFESLTKSDELSKTNFLTGIPEDDKINFLKVTEILKEYLKPSLYKRSRLGFVIDNISFASQVNILIIKIQASKSSPVSLRGLVSQSRRSGLVS